MSIIIGCDNIALTMKNRLIKHLNEMNVEVHDVGCFSEQDQIFYPLVAEKVCEGVLESEGQKRGILICGTGIGMAITANKFKGIRAAVCHDNYSCERSVLSNNCNILCMGARVIGVELAKKIVNEWINLQFVDGNSTPKIKAITNIEQKNFNS